MGKVSLGNLGSLLLKGGEVPPTLIGYIKHPSGASPEEVLPAIVTFLGRPRSPPTIPPTTPPLRPAQDGYVHARVAPADASRHRREFTNTPPVARQAISQGRLSWPAIL